MNSNQLVRDKFIFDSFHEGGKTCATCTAEIPQEPHSTGTKNRLYLGDSAPIKPGPATS
jgi:hypothetical protein